MEGMLGRNDGLLLFQVEESRVSKFRSWECPHRTAVYKEVPSVCVHSGAGCRMRKTVLLGSGNEIQVYNLPSRS